MANPQARLVMAASIVEFEGRRDRQGRLKVYKLDPDDGGGSYEVAGINDRYHPEEAHQLAALIAAGRHEEAEEQAKEIIATYTDCVLTWTRVAAVECYLRDCAFNRGPRGAARMLQRAVGVPDDGVIGPHTRAAIARRESEPRSLLQELREAREHYERHVARRDESNRYWKGLVKRWNKALEVALTFLVDETPRQPTAARQGPLRPQALVPGTLPLDATAEPPASESPALALQVARAVRALNTPVLLRPLRLGSQGNLVWAWQTFLLGRGFDPGELDGDFGDKTEQATRAFQDTSGLTVDGVAGRETLLAAMSLGFELIEEPAPDTSGSNFPPKPEFPPLLGSPARRAVFGTFEYVADPRPDNRERVRILGTWERDNIVSVPIPQLRKALGPSAPTGMRFHRAGAAQLKGLWREWEQENLLGLVKSYDGAFVPRFIRGSNIELSNHAFGSAFDINADSNPLGARPPLVGEPCSVRLLVPIAHKWGFYWGGHFANRSDGMHFEIAILHSGTVQR